MTATATREVAPGPFPADAVPGRVSRTPRRLALIMGALAVLGLAAGVSGVTSVQSRSALVDEVTTRSGPLVVSAQELYRSLSDADATVASAFLADGPEPPELRERYQTDIADAGAALARVSSGVNEGRAASSVAVLSVQLPVYSGLVETARAFHRQGLPVGAAYLREASGVMRERLLPAAEELFQAVSGDLDDARDGAAGFPGFAVLLGVVTLGALVIAQIWLANRTRRVFNIGLVVASLAALVSLLWLGFSWSSADSHLDASDQHGSAQVALLSQSRITALQARSDEAHTLVARGAGGAYEENYQELAAALTGPDGLLGEARDRATDAPAERAASAAGDAAVEWQEIHEEVRRLDDVEGDYPAAVAMTIGPEPDSAGGAFGRLDEALGEGIGHANEQFAREAEQAGSAFGGVGLGIGVLTALLLVGVVAGVQQRLAEYR